MGKEVDTTFIKALGARIRKVRRKKNLTMEQLAYTCDIEYSQISRIERGIINTSVHNIYLIAKALEVPIVELFDFKVS